MINRQIQDLLKYFDFSGPSKFSVYKLLKCGCYIECFISQKVDILEHKNIVLLKGDIKTYVSSTEQSLSLIRGLRNWYIKKVNFNMRHPVLICKQTEKNFVSASSYIRYLWLSDPSMRTYLRVILKSYSCFFYETSSTWC